MKFRFEQVIESSREGVFAFHADPSNLAVLFAGRPAFRLLHHDGGIRPGCVTWIEETVAGCAPVVMGFRHTIYEPPDRFGEELIHGPYERFVHIHEFEERTEAATLVRDRLDVSLPWQYGGEAAIRWIVAPMIRSTFGFRQRALRKLAAAGDLMKQAASYR